MLQWEKQISLRVCLTSSNSPSFMKDSTSDPITGAQVFSVNTFRINGSCSPCLMTMLAICITESFSGSGNIPENFKKERQYLWC